MCREAANAPTVVGRGESAEERSARGACRERCGGQPHLRHIFLDRQVAVLIKRLDELRRHPAALFAIAHVAPGEIGNAVIDGHGGLRRNQDENGKISIGASAKVDVSGGGSVGLGDGRVRGGDRG